MSRVPPKSSSELEQAEDMFKKSLEVEETPVTTKDR